MRRNAIRGGDGGVSRAGRDGGGGEGSGISLKVQQINKVHQVSSIHLRENCGDLVPLSFPVVLVVVAMLANSCTLGSSSSWTVDGTSFSISGMFWSVDFSGDSESDSCLRRLWWWRWLPW